MKKSVSLILAILLIMSTVLVGCSSSKLNEGDKTSADNKIEGSLSDGAAEGNSSNSENPSGDSNGSTGNGNSADNQNSSPANTTKGGLDLPGGEFGFENVTVTNKNGETVTDKKGNAVTTEVPVEYVTDKEGETHAVEIDDKGEHVTDDKGNDVTHTTNKNTTTRKAPTTKPALPSVPKTEPTTASTTMTTEKTEATTAAELTTIKPEKVVVPLTSDSGEEVIFANSDQQIIKQMLEVPYLYNSSYENSEGVPIDAATHVAIWMAQREGFNTTSYASSTVVLDLFKYFAQTVVNFKTYCNEANNENITYKSSSDTFIISSFEAPTHSVALNSIEYLGNNNFYKVTGTVSGTDKAKKVVAIVQKNRLDTSLGFSIKALKWTK